MRLIDADALDRSFSVAGAANEDSYTDGVLLILGRVEDAPTVDAVPVVRCKDCRFWITGAENFCDLDGQDRKSYWFCADGERKGGDE